MANGALRGRPRRLCGQPPLCLAILPKGQAAAPAINSCVLREIPDNCLAHGPDLLIVYMGNNEVIGPFVPGEELFSWPARSPPGPPGPRAAG